ncbi:MAG TPA: NADH-quinone oxidoreductase subunit N [Gemmatimonadaceae bacterium]|nr:NADH-quinone oxidoreductase subunit N [Gemmatimonadaceae bacterium]
MLLDLARPGQLALALGPDIVLLVGAMVLLLIAVARPDSDEHQRAVGIGAIAVCVLTIAAILFYVGFGLEATPGMVAVDVFRWSADVIFLLGAILALAMSIDYERRQGIVLAESHVMVLLATSGMMLLGAARDLILVFLGIELMSVAVYVLSGLNRRSAAAAEAALKYFLLGAFSTGFLLYGIALVYGATGSTNLGAIGSWVARNGAMHSPMLLVGMGLLIVGFGFKVAAVPFHMYTPDVYEGAPTPYTAYMAAAVKAAAFAAFLRVWLEAFNNAGEAWHGALWGLALATMIVGNVVALAQRNIKRLLAYSSVAHAGYLLVAVVVGTTAGASAFVFYLLAYTLATMGAFAVVAAVAHTGERHIDLRDFDGLWRVRPWTAVAMAVFMLALLGFPIVGGMGFFAKWYILLAALRAPTPEVTLAVVVVLTSVVSAGYYLAVVMNMFMRSRPATAPEPGRVPRVTGVVIAVTAVLLLVFGIYPNPIARLVPSTTPATAAGPAPGTLAATARR